MYAKRKAKRNVRILETDVKHDNEFETSFSEVLLEYQSNIIVQAKCGKTTIA